MTPTYIDPDNPANEVTVEYADIRPQDHDERMAVARRVAQWELGDPSWAGEIVGAYLYPDAAQHRLDAEGA